MIAGSLVGAVAAYLFQVVGGRRLGTVAFAPIAVLWTVFFIVATVDAGSSRAIRHAGGGTRTAGVAFRSSSDDPDPPATGSGLGGFVYVMRDRLFAGEAIFALQAFLLTVGYGMMQIGKGILAGHRQFARYGAVLGLEGDHPASLRRRLPGALGQRRSALGWAMVAAPTAVYLLGRPWSHDRETVVGVVATPARGFLVFLRCGRRGFPASTGGSSARR